LKRFPRVLPVGDAALSVELGETIDPALNARVRALDRSLQRLPVEGVRETVPTYRSLLVLYEPRDARFADLRDTLLERLEEPAAAEDASTLHVVPTRYGGADGPDLADVARRAGITEAEAVSYHTGCEYTAYMLGFTPGFAYLGSLPEALETPRRATPRTRVPEGSVALAGRQTSIYPSASPGGWNLIGRTSLKLFDPAADPPALVLPGDRVRFVSVPDLQLRSTAGRSTNVRGPASVEVLDGGLLTSVQGEDRVGHRRLGVTWAGPMDRPAHHAANALVGNPEGVAALECTIAGPRLRFLATTTFVVCGADLGAVLERADLGIWEVPLGMRVLARAGNVLAFRARRTGCRAYIAFAGGIDVPEVLGSRSTDLTGGFGGFEGRALRAGDRLALGNPRSSAGPRRRLPTASDVATVSVVLGPQADRLVPESVALFLDSDYAVTVLSDRVGCRLDGPPLRHAGPPEIVTDGMVFGSIQVPPDGQPIVMMADAPTTGGYPKIATVVSIDLALLAQLTPGIGRVRFQALSLEEAQLNPPAPRRA